MSSGSVPIQRTVPDLFAPALSSSTVGSEYRTTRMSRSLASKPLASSSISPPGTMSSASVRIVMPVVAGGVAAAARFWPTVETTDVEPKPTLLTAPTVKVTGSTPKEPPPVPPLPLPPPLIAPDTGTPLQVTSPFAPTDLPAAPRFSAKVLPPAEMVPELALVTVMTGLLNVSLMRPLCPVKVTTPEYCTVPVWLAGSQELLACGNTYPPLPPPTPLVFTDPFAIGPVA